MWYHYSHSINRGREIKTKTINTKYMPISIKKYYISFQKKKKNHNCPKFSRHEAHLLAKTVG